MLVEIIIDESPSEYAVDPHGHRHVAARRIVELLRTDLACRGDRVAVVHFAERPEPVLRPQDPHTRRGHRRLRRSLRPQGVGATTDICAALETAARLVPKRWLGPTVTLVMTDGLDESSPEDLAAAVGRFPPRSVHLISVGTEVPGTWSYVPLGSVTIVRSVERPDAIEWRVAQVIYLALGVS
jgi:Mg-chelatase subunit ChlD